MANMQRMGGIGSGIMQGLQFMRQRESDARQDQALENQNQQLQMHKQQFDWQAQERARQDELTKGFQSIMADTNKTDAEKYSTFASQYGSKMRPDEHLAMRKNVEPLIQQFGRQALDAALFGGDVSGLQKVIDMRMPGAKVAFDGTGSAFVVTTPDAKTRTIDRSGLATALSLTDWQKSQQESQKLAGEADMNTAKVRLANAQAGRIEREPIGAGSLSRAHGVPGEGGGDLFKTADLEAVTPLDQNGKPDPQKLANIGANLESMIALNPALRGSKRTLLAIAAGIEKGDIKPEMVWDQATNSYYKAVKFGSGTVRIGHESEADPDTFYANNPAAIKVRINNDRAWLGQYTQSIADPKQRETMGLALRADSPQGAAARNEIITAYNKVKSSGQPIPLFLRQQYSALQTADRLKSAPPEEQKPAQARTATPPIDMSIHGKPTYAAYIDASEKLETVLSNARSMSPDRREVYLSARVPELEALVKHHIKYLENHH